MPVIDWTEGKLTTGRSGAAIEVSKEKASWLPQFLLHNGGEQNPRHPHDIEVVLPGKKK